MSALVFFHLLADRHGVPAALLFEQDGAPPSASAAQAGEQNAQQDAAPAADALRALSARWPCFYPDQLAPAAAAPLRAALAGRTVTPSVFDMMLVIGRDETIARLEDAAA